MGDLRTWLNAIGIFGATSFVVFYFDVSPLWYGAALLAWIVRRQAVYHAQAGSAANASAETAARPSASADSTAPHF
jgi:hypothetical protein